MTQGFNLLDEQWIPCLAAKDEAMRELSLHTALAQASEIKEIVHESPLVVMALHRLMLAIIHRVFGPSSPSDWMNIWGAGAWNQQALDGYLHKWHTRFDLFDQRHPFYQVASLDFTRAAPVSRLLHELASGNNTTLFDHTSDSVSVSLTPAEAARYLVAYQAFTLGGLITPEKGQTRSADAAPLAKGAVVLLRGDNLFQTLMLNLHHYSAVHEAPFHFHTDEDMPAWERAEETQAEDRWPSGYLDLLTWQSRRVRLQPEVVADGRIEVRWAVIMKGNQFPDGFVRHGRETMLAFTKRQRAAANQEPWPAVVFSENRALWRDSLALLQSIADQRERPKTMEWVYDLVYEHGALDRSLILPLDVAGLSANRAKVEFWRHERLPLPLAYLGDDTLCAELRQALALAEQTGDLFLAGFGKVSVNGKTLNVPRPLQLLGATLASPSEGRKPDQDTARRIVEALAPGRLYWSRLETPFRAFLVALPQDVRYEDGEPVYGLEELPKWARTLHREARSAFEETTRSLDRSARALKAVAVAERAFNRQLNDILGEYLEQTKEATDESTN